jgi:hypothetical protein
LGRRGEGGDGDGQAQAAGAGRLVLRRGVIADYLKVHGAGSLAGLNYVDTVTKSDPSYFGEGFKVQPLMFSEDLATNIAATRQSCTIASRSSRARTISRPCSPST